MSKFVMHEIHVFVTDSLLSNCLKFIPNEVNGESSPERNFCSICAVG
jgi:hypothetical protein